MGQVLNANDFAAAQAVKAAKLNELGFVPICMAPAQEDEGHSHTMVEEIVIVQSGEGKIQIENDTYDLCAGSVAIVPAGQFHALCNTGKGNLEAVTIFNSNVKRDEVVLKSREEHFGGANGDEGDVQGQLQALTETIKGLQKAVDSLQKKKK